MLPSSFNTIDKKRIIEYKSKVIKMGRDDLVLPGGLIKNERPLAAYYKECCNIKHAE